jgi:hypothetical protein
VSIPRKFPRSALSDFGPFSTQQAIELRRHGVTAESMREAQKWGFTKLSSEQIVKLKRAGVI